MIMLRNGEPKREGKGHFETFQRSVEKDSRKQRKCGSKNGPLKKKAETAFGLHQQSRGNEVEGKGTAS